MPLPTPPTPIKPTIAVSLGDPLGVGPEVTLKALADPNRRAAANWIIFGAQGPLLEAADRANIHPFWWRLKLGSGLEPSALNHEVILLEDTDDPRWVGAAVERAPTKSAGEASFRWVELAIQAALGKGPAPASALVTAPISKKAWSLAGRGKWPGHTELLTDRMSAKRTRMMFATPNMRVMLATAHIPLMTLRDELTIGAIHDTIDLAHQACIDLGVPEPRIAVCGLNPHAGEDGILGDEDQRLITPAIKHANLNGINAQGPFPADTIFRSAVRAPGRTPKYDIVVAMYHDQGLIPVKLLDFETAVNITMGLPAPRTSPDHGTAYDIAGKDKANPSSMAAACDLAIQLATKQLSAASSTP